MIFHCPVNIRFSSLTWPFFFSIKSNEVTCTWKHWWHKVYYTHVIILKLALITFYYAYYHVWPETICFPLNVLSPFCPLHDFSGHPSRPLGIKFQSSLLLLLSLFIIKILWNISLHLSVKNFYSFPFIYSSRITPGETFSHVMQFSFQSVLFYSW